MPSVSIYIVPQYGLGRKEMVRGKGRKNGSTGLDLLCHLCAISLSALISPSLSVAGSRCWVTQWKPSLGGLCRCAAPHTPSAYCQSMAACFVVHFCHLPDMKRSPWEGMIYRHSSGSTDLTNI